MDLRKYYEPIDIEKSSPNNKSLIMPHQQEAVKALKKYFNMGRDLENRNGLLIMPTGSGKTYTTVNWLMTDAVARGYRVIWLVHRQELVTQAYNEFVKQAPLLKGTGIKKLRILPISGAHVNMSRASRADIYVCSIASVANSYGYRFIARMIGAQGRRKLVIVIDEAHHAVASNYQKVIRRMTALNPNRILLGLTATPKRMQDSEQRKLQALFNVDQNLKKKKGMHGFVYEVTMASLLASGFLSDPISERVDTKIVGDTTFNITEEDQAFFDKFGELSERLMDEIGRNSARNKIILEQYLKNQKRYGKTLIFAINQNHARALYEDFKEAGVSCDYIVSSKPGSQNTIRDFKENKFKVLINVMMMTEGSDVPDIQTVFLTRETNSEALLRQMIGRGLRGVKAGGTKEAYIVSFYDIWDRFGGFMDPAALDIFPENQEPEEEEKPVDEKLMPALEPNKEMLKYLEELAKMPPVTNKEEDHQEEEEFSVSDLYMRLYHLMKASIVEKENAPEVADGWLSVDDFDGNEQKIIVFKSQIAGYRSMDRNKKLLIANQDISGEDVQEIYFRENPLKPSADDLDLILQYMDDTGSMPEYFTFSARDAWDPKKIAETVNQLYKKEEDKENWLKEYYDQAPVLQNIYRSFYAFKKTVFDCMKKSVSEDIEKDQLELEKYHIVENQYDLNEIMEELKADYPGLSQDGLTRIEWSKHVVISWFALCTRSSDGAKYQLHVNKLLSSPDVDKQVIKYLLFHELLHANGYWKHDMEFRRREWQFPNSAELDGFLDELGIRYDLGDIMEHALYDEHYNDDGSVVGESAPLHEGKENLKSPTSEDSKSQSEETSSTVSDDNENNHFNPKAKGVVEGYKYCRNCGNRLPADAKFCDKCGSKVNY